MRYGIILILVTLATAAWGSGVVSIFEMRFGVPGTMHVAPECSCTFKYMGTRVQGTDYFVHFKKMD